MNPSAPSSTPATSTLNMGRVESVTNEICRVSGLQILALSDVVEFSSKVRGIVFGFTENEAEIIILGDYHLIKKGDPVRVVSHGLNIPVGPKLLGRVINPLGEPMDQLGSFVAENTSYIETPAKPVSDRDFITRPLNTGFLMIDSQIPIGLGQRELLVGEKKVGKDEVAIEIICNQPRVGSGVLSVYVAIDNETSAVKRNIERLRATGALGYTVVVVGRSSDPASYNYLAPMTGVTIAEAFANAGKDVLLVIDDLTRHAKAYRHLSLLLGRPSGREAYPGDIFFLHSRLLERCGAFTKPTRGSITALPLVETQGEEITDYITTNLMSITDGHIMFRQSLANKGIQPAVDSGFSVSRIGGRAQIPVIRELSDQLKQTIIRYHEVERYLAFGSSLQEETAQIVNLGKYIYRLFNQQANETLSPIEEIVLIYFVTTKRILDWEISQLPALRDQYLSFIRNPSQAGQLITRVLGAPNLASAEPVLQGLQERFIKDPGTIKPVEEAPASAAEHETIIDLLRDTNGNAHGPAN